MCTTFSFLLSIFLLAGVTCGSNSWEMSPVEYWNKLLPKTPIPEPLHAFLPKGFDHLSQRKPMSVPHTFTLYHRYKSGATLAELIGDHEVDFLFLEENLMPGSKTKKLDFVKKEQGTRGWPTALPRKEAQGFPFSTSKLASILKRYSIDPNSADASMVKLTLQQCEKEANMGETRYCATSLESMVDFVVSQLGTNDIQLLTYSFANKEETEPKSRVYTIQPGAVEWVSPQKVACHLQSYPYAVFYCHKTTNTKTYIVPLVAEEDGTTVKAGALCHTDTSSWNPNHASMLALGIKPGSPVCHFLSHGHFVFVPNSVS